MVQSAPEARYRNPPPRFTSEQKKSNAASELESSDEEKTLSSDEEDEDQCDKVYQVLADVRQINCRCLISAWRFCA